MIRHRLKDGSFAEFDKAHEFVAYLRLLGLAGDEQPGTPTGIDALLALIEGSRMMTLMRLVADRGSDETTLDQIRRALGDETNAIAGGTISGLRRNCKKCNLDVDDVISRTREGTYMAGPLLREIELPPPAEGEPAIKSYGRSSFERLMDDDDIIGDNQEPDD